ncbi:hypothetical protein K469DRAFT_500109, partial [Zopfia rhizophila CBS 207.26]
DYTIELEKDTTISFRLLYNLSLKELKVLRDYIAEVNLVSVLILFISKKNSSLQLYVNYRGLNKIT